MLFMKESQQTLQFRACDLHGGLAVLTTKDQKMLSAECKDVIMHHLSELILFHSKQKEQCDSKAGIYCAENT